MQQKYRAKQLLHLIYQNKAKNLQECAQCKHLPLFVCNHYFVPECCCVHCLIKMSAIVRSKFMTLRFSRFHITLSRHRLILALISINPYQISLHMLST